MTTQDDDWGRQKLSAGMIAAPAISLVAMFIAWRLDFKWLAAPIIALIILFYVFVPRLVRTRTRRFHKQSLALLAAGKAADVPRLARRNLLLQLFGASAPVDAKLGLAYSQLNEWNQAISHLESALPTAPETEQPALRLALVKALFITGDPARAETEALAVLRQGLRLPELLVIVARAQLGLDKKSNQVAKLLDEAETLRPPPDVETMIDLCRAELLLEQGKPPSSLPERQEPAQRFVRVWRDLVAGKLHESAGDVAAAVERYSAAVSLGRPERCWFSDLAYARLEKLAAATDPSQAPSDNKIDPALERKRRKRR